MATYERSVRIGAPLETVWEFHSTADGLRALTPDWMGLRIEATRGPDGDPDPETLTAGTTLDVSVGPFDRGPRQHWTSEIVAREHEGERAYFRDVMTDGPFETWAHTHRFVADGEDTLITDTVEYQLPFGRLGAAVSPLAVIGFEPMFAYRHRETAARLGRPDRGNDALSSGGG